MNCTAWTITRNSGTIDIFMLNLSCIVEKSEENGFELAATGNVDYIANTELDFSGLRLNATYDNGKTEPIALENLTIDASGVNTAAEGVYDVLIYYKDYAPITIQVYIYSPAEIVLGYDAIEQISNTSYGNGVYYNHSFRELYFVGEEFDENGLSVIVVAKCGEKELQFKVDDYTVSGFDSESADIMNLTIAAAGVSTSIELWVTDVNPTPNADGVYQLLVDPGYEGLPGALVGPYHTFSTIQESLDYMAKIDANAMKELCIAPGPIPAADIFT